MRRSRFDIVGFDLDGTLVDTSRDLSAAVNHTLVQAGRAPLPVEQVVTMIGGGTRHLLAQALAATGGCDDPMLDALLVELLDYHAAHLCDHSLPYPGVVDALDRLTVSGARLGIATNKIARFTLPLLDALDLARHFTAVIAGDTLDPGMAKPSPAPIRAMIEACGGGPAAFVGDSRYDVMAAHAAGLPVVAYRYGFAPEGVDAIGADAIIDHHDQLIATLERL